MDVLEEVEHKYVRPLDADKMRELVENMINGGLERLDPHSNFINADEYKQFTKHSRGKFGGIGIRIDLERPAKSSSKAPWWARRPTRPASWPAT